MRIAPFRSSGRSVDEAAIDGRKTLVQRLLVSILAAGVLQASLAANVMLPWFLLLAGSEILTWLGTRTIGDGAPGTTGQRVLFITHVALSTGLWSLVCIWLWSSGHTGLHAVGAVIICAQLIHAQGFTYRSPVVFAISAGVPAVVISALTLGYADLSGLDLLTATAGLALTFAYVAAGTRANMINARTIAAAQMELESLAYTDALTALANRRRFSEALKDLITTSQACGTPFALMLIDLDGFKTVNDRLGHDIGDEVLVAVADCLRAVVKHPDQIARLGGDEFALLVRNVSSTAHVAKIFGTIADGLSSSETVRHHRLQATISIGAATYPGNGREAESLLKAADLALYEAKNAGRNTWRAHAPGVVATTDIRTVEPGPAIVERCRAEAVSTT